MCLDKQTTEQPPGGPKTAHDLCLGANKTRTKKDADH